MEDTSRALDPTPKEIHKQKGAYVAVVKYGSYPEENL